MSNTNESGIRLNKFIADCGVASRRKADELIETGQVTVNGKRVFELGLRVVEKDSVKVNGKLIKKETQKFYLMFHKPKGVITSLVDPHGRVCVGDYFAKFEARIYPIGRLDYDTEGLLLMTNDGDFANLISHPKNEVLKTYIAKLNKKVDPEKLKKLLTGVSIREGGKVSAKSAVLLKQNNTEARDWVKIIIAEGKNHQVRKMFEKIGYDVLKLQRIAIGGLELGTLNRGAYRELKINDINKIFRTKVIGKKKKIRQTSKKKISPET